MAQFDTDGQARLLIPLLLRPSQFFFGWPTRMGRWPASEFPIPLLVLDICASR
jgi:hypothetical protein